MSIHCQERQQLEGVALLEDETVTMCPCTHWKCTGRPIVVVVENKYLKCIFLNQHGNEIRNEQ